MRSIRRVCDTRKLDLQWYDDLAVQAAKGRAMANEQKVVEW